MTKVKLRTKLIKGAKESLFLDFYPPILHPDTGKKTRWEYLGLYLYNKPKTSIEKNHNVETHALAEHIRAKRQLEVQNNQYEFLSETKRNSNFIEYFQTLLETKSEMSQGVWYCTLKHLKSFTGGSIRFADLSVNFCNDFRQYLLHAKRIRSEKFYIAQNTAHTYLVALKTALKRAYKEGLLKNDISLSIEPIKRTETVRSYLTLDELNRLTQTECSYQYIREVSLFSALTGLRFSDIAKLVWSEVHVEKDKKGKNMYSLHFVQKKTKGVEVLPISEQAYHLLGERGKPDEKVYEGLKYSDHINDLLRNWTRKAGISKKVTFHCFRYTFATLQLSAGTDLYTVSKLLGHRNINTTQIYAKVVDRSKQEAVDRIKLDFSPIQPVLKSA